MIALEDRIYYTDPIQPPNMVRRNQDGTTPTEYKVLAQKYRVPRSSKTELIGTEVAVTAQRFEEGELWWVDTDGDHLMGAQISNNHPNRFRMVAVVDDVFVVGTGYGHIGGGVLLRGVLRSDGKTHSLGPGSDIPAIVREATIAAPWALDLMPVAGDSQAVVDQKVALAKQRYAQRFKKGMIYREGMARDWLDHLTEVRADGHDMPVPVFRVGMVGMFLTDTGAVAEAALTAAQSEAIANVRSQPIRSGYSDTIRQYIAVPYCAVSSFSVNSREEMRAISNEDLTYSLRSSYSNYSGTFTETTRFPVLASF
jgi:hypothetical protein